MCEPLILATADEAIPGCRQLHALITRCLLIVGFGFKSELEQNIWEYHISLIGNPNGLNGLLQFII